jgi:hypothetical protein
MDPANPPSTSLVTFALDRPQTSRSWNDFTVEVRRDNQSFVGRVPASRGIALTPGMYFATARLPSGYETTTGIFVGPGKSSSWANESDYHVSIGQPLTILFQDATGSPARPSSSREDLLPLRTLSKNILMDSLSRLQPAAGGLERMGAGPEEQVPQIAGEDVDVASNHLPGRVDWYQGNPLSPATLVARSDMPATIPFDSEVAINPPPSGLLVAQWRRPQQLALNLVLPVCGPSGCRCVVHYIEGQQPQLDVILNNGDADVIVRYLHAGYTTDAASYFNARAAAQLLEEKMADPIGALVGAYALLRFPTVDANAGDPSRWERWCENLQEAFPQIPDTLIIRAEQLARANNHLEALNRLLRLPERGLPLFSRGLSLAIDRLAVYYHACQSGEHSENLPLDQTTLQQTRNLLVQLRSFGAYTLYSIPYLCYSGLKPSEPSQQLLPNAI